MKMLRSDETAANAPLPYLAGGVAALSLFDSNSLVGLLIILLLIVALIVLRIIFGGDRGKRAEIAENRQARNLDSGEAPEIRVDPKLPPAPASGALPFTDPPGVTTTTREFDTNIVADSHRFRKAPPSTEVKKLEVVNPGEAAGMWERLSRWNEAAQLHREIGNNDRACDIFLAIEKYDDALPLLRERVKGAPGDENLRLKLIETLFNTQNYDEAMELVRAADSAAGAVPASAAFFESLALTLEAAHQNDMAEELYRRALQLDDNRGDVAMRLQFIGQTKRLNATPVSGEGPGDLLRRAALDSGTVSISQVRAPHPEASGYEVIVGHLALGFEKPEPRHGIGSIFSSNRRFMFEELLSESKRSAVFKARDRLLDFPVALKLYRFPDDFTGMETLRTRLLAIAQLNHPNLAKLTFVDRDRMVLRTATEFLPGGNLNEFFNRSGGVGIPLVIRMAMHVASALHAAHQHGVPHGDLRTENLMIGTDQRIKLIDFALSPIPIQVPVDPTIDSESDTLGFGQPVKLGEGIESDMLQFADLMEFMLDHARVAESGVSDAVNDTSEDVRELIGRVRERAFVSMIRLWQILHGIFERTIPPSASGERPKI